MCLSSQDLLPNMRFQVEQLQRNRAALESTLKAQRKAMDEVCGGDGVLTEDM
jgi:hypothetical protein